MEMSCGGQSDAEDHNWKVSLNGLRPERLTLTLNLIPSIPKSQVTPTALPAVAQPCSSTALTALGHTNLLSTEPAYLEADARDLSGRLHSSFYSCLANCCSHAPPSGTLRPCVGPSRRLCHVLFSLYFFLSGARPAVVPL